MLQNDEKTVCHKWVKVNISKHVACNLWVLPVQSPKNSLWTYEPRREETGLWGF